MKKTLILIATTIVMAACEGQHGTKTDDRVEEEISRESSAKAIGDVIFEEIGGKTEVVAQVNERFAFVRSKGSDKRNGHFGGNLIDCSSSEFYCIDGIISTSLPKSGSKDRWTFNGYECSKNEIDQESETKVECISSDGNRNTSATLSRDGGIVGFGSRTSGTDSKYRSSDAAGFPFIR